MDRFSLPFLVKLVANRDGLDDAFAAEISRRLRRLRDDGMVRPVKGTGGKGRGNSAELDLHEAAAALILETLTPMDLATEARAAAREAFDRKDDLSLPREPGVTRTGKSLTSLTAALEGIERGEAWILRFQYVRTRKGRTFKARIVPDEDRAERLIAAALALKGEALLGTIIIPLNVILNPLIEAKEK